MVARTDSPSALMAGPMFGNGDRSASPPASLSSRLGVRVQLQPGGAPLVVTRPEKSDDIDSAASFLGNSVAGRRGLHSLGDRAPCHDPQHVFAERNLNFDYGAGDATRCEP